MVVSVLLVAALLWQQAEPLSTYPLASDRLLDAAPAVEEHAHTTLYGYEITAGDRTTVLAAMRSDGPAEDDGTRFYGRTVWQYSFEPGYRGDVCDPKLMEVSYRAGIILPDLTTRDALTRIDLAAWDAFFPRLIEHELNHLKVADEGRVSMEEAMQAAPDCDAAIAAGAAMNGQIHGISQDYDRRTNHGATESATF